MKFFHSIDYIFLFFIYDINFQITIDNLNDLWFIIFKKKFKSSVFMEGNSTKCKIVLLGDQSVGKTSIINRFIFDNFTGNEQVLI